MKWTGRRIVAELKALRRRSVDLSYNAMARRRQALVSAAAYHFGSYRHAVAAAGVDYADVTRRPRWTRRRIIAEIKKAHRSGRPLNWAAATERRDELAMAGYAALRPEFFGNWPRALQAAGLSPETVCLYRRWTRHDVLFELRERRQCGEGLSSGQIQREDPALHAAATRLFRGLANALRAAGIDPQTVALRRSWTRRLVADELRPLLERHPALTYAQLRRENMPLYGAVLRLFKTLDAARRFARQTQTRRRKR